MNPIFRRAGIAVLGLLLCACTAGGMSSGPVAAGAPQQPDPAMRALAGEVFVYGYPLVLMDVTRETMSARTAPNAFHHARVFPDASFTDVVSPNADTLYSTAWLNLGDEPVVLTVPAMRGRYYLVQMLDAWTNVFAAPGTRTAPDGRAVDYAITGPAFTGRLPQGVVEIRSPSQMVWLIGRIQTNGKRDYGAVNRLQDQFKLTPLSAWGRTGQSAAREGPMALSPREGSPADQVAQMDAQAFFSRLAELLPANPPLPGDGVMVAKMARLGIVAGQPFKTTVLEPSTARAVQEGATAALARIQAAARPAAGTGGWQVARNLGSYGSAYLQRAVVARTGLGANLPQDALYPNTRTDADGQPLDGASRYVMHFPKGQLPPVRAFWSLTLYDEKHAFAANPLGRYALGDRDRLRRNRDGSLDLYIQHERPQGARVANWLPAPAGPFGLTMRLYWPKAEALDGNWMPPPVRRER